MGEMFSFWRPAIATYKNNAHFNVTTTTRYARQIKDMLISLMAKTKTYNSRDSLVVTHPATNRPVCGLSTVNSWVGASRVS